MDRVDEEADRSMMIEKVHVEPEDEDGYIGRGESDRDWR